MNVMNGKKIRNFQLMNEISCTALLISYIKYKLFYNKHIIIGTKTVINNPKNINIAPGGRLRIGLSNIGIYTKEDITYINIRPSGSLNIYGSVGIGRGSRIFVENNALLVIGENTAITGASKIVTGNEIYIGSNCMISWDVQILDTDYHEIYVDGELSNPSKGITIEDNVWIGSRATILKGVKIGKGSVIASNSVVTKNVEPHTLVAGNPAVVKKKNINWKV
jgi:acetyltransferase-like isoleucine patch superfamily enzyme